MCGAETDCRESAARTLRQTGVPRTHFYIHRSISQNMKIFEKSRHLRCTQGSIKWYSRLNCMNKRAYLAHASSVYGVSTTSVFWKIRYSQFSTIETEHFALNFIMDAMDLNREP